MHVKLKFVLNKNNKELFLGFIFKLKLIQLLIL